MAGNFSPFFVTNSSANNYSSNVHNHRSKYPGLIPFRPGSPSSPIPTDENSLPQLISVHSSALRRSDGSGNGASSPNLFLTKRTPDLSPTYPPLICRPLPPPPTSATPSSSAHSPHSASSASTNLTAHTLTLRSLPNDNKWNSFKDKQTLREEELMDKYYQYWSEKQRNGPWTTTNGSYRGDSTTQVTESSPSGSQSALLNSGRKMRQQWPKGKDFLFSTWAFVVGAHSLWELPVLTLRYGGVVFILVYLAVFLIVGSPLLLLEMGLGQYSALAITKFYRHMCPILTGLGFAVCVSCILHAMTDLAVIAWSGHAIYNLFSSRTFPENFFNNKVLEVRVTLEEGKTSPTTATGLDNLGDLHGQLVLCLGISCIILFIFVAASSKSIGKVSMALVPICYGLLMTLTIRGCMGPGGPQGILVLLTPDWTHITKPWVWLEATRIVFTSLQLGLGVISTYASYNKYHHNIIRDAGIIAIGHFVWSILCVIFVFSLLGVSHNSQSINIDQLIRNNIGSWLLEDGSVVSITGRNFWLVGVTLAESSLASLEYNWLWSGLLFLLLIFTCASTVLGCVEVLAASAVDEFTSIRSYKPAIIFTFLSCIFMLDLSMATNGGIHIYYLLSTYYTTSWPLFFFGIATVLGASYSHGGKYLMKDLGDMSKMPLTHFISSHLSVIYSTVVPIMLMTTMGWILYSVSHEHILRPLANFSMRLPNDWGMPLGWAITFIPFAITIAGLLFNLLWMSRGVPFKMHLKRSFKPSDEWYENEHRELLQQELSNGGQPKDRSIVAFQQGKRNGNTTEV